jgi:hypothetical protein
MGKMKVKFLHLGEYEQYGIVRQENTTITKQSPKQHKKYDNTFVYLGVSCNLKT